MLETSSEILSFEGHVKCSFLDSLLSECVGVNTYEKYK